MSEKETLNEISDSLQQIADSSKEIVYIMKPKPKKPDIVSMVAWIIIGAGLLYVLYDMYKFIAKL